MDLKAVRGMHDLFGEEIRHWHFVEKKVRQILAAFGYEEIRTPVLEKKEVFSEAVGSDTDIVEKQMYQVAGDASEALVLRPEGTASFIRAVVEHGLHRTGHAQRYYYYLPMFRHERPQKGRQRQFFQFGAELINDPSPEADAEIIVLLDTIYKAFGVSQYEIRINSVGCDKCRPAYKQKLTDFFRPHLSELCPQCQARFERAPIRILDCKNEGCQELAKKAPKMIEHLCSDCLPHHNRFKECLNVGGISFVEDTSIVRGLDYYKRTAFEFTSNLLGAQSALCGGGRYDGLSERFSEKPFPAIGFGLGMERLMMVVTDFVTKNMTATGPSLFLAPLGEKSWSLLYPLGLSWRMRGLSVALNHDKQKGLKSLLKEANRLNARFTLLLGEDEMNAGHALLKNMATGDQEKVALASLDKQVFEKVIAEGSKSAS